MEIEVIADECQLGCLDNQECFPDNGHPSKKVLLNVPTVH